MSIYVTIAVGVFSVFLWEYIQIDTDSNVKPSFVLNLLADWAIYLFKQCGVFAAWISSYLTYIKFEKIKRSIVNIILPLWHLVTSFTWFVKGYVDTALSYGFHVTLVGSILIILIVLFLVCYYFNIPMWPASVDTDVLKVIGVLIVTVMCVLSIAVLGFPA
tara:strand:- start:128 stop:610 length:483 start_codon:yes stop_codon:yes gene_type:complete